MKRYAIVRNADSLKQLEAYLPDNYRVIWTTSEEFRAKSSAGIYRAELPLFVIEGRDVAGWTLDGYVIPRLASGVIWAEEIDLSHPIMKEVPVERSCAICGGDEHGGNCDASYDDQRDYAEEAFNEQLLREE